jgi:hypothetical protein
MNRLIVFAAALVMMSSSAHAQAVKLRGPAADAFVAKYFPNADVPGRVKGEFTYTSKSGRKGSGLAKMRHSRHGRAIGRRRFALQGYLLSENHRAWPDLDLTTQPRCCCPNAIDASCDEPAILAEVAIGSPKQAAAKDCLQRRE